MNRTAYLLLCIDSRTFTVTSAGIFSEATPTTTRHQLYAQLAEWSAADFASAARYLHDCYAHGWPALAARFPLPSEP